MYVGNSSLISVLWPTTIHNDKIPSSRYLNSMQNASLFNLCYFRIHNSSFSQSCNVKVIVVAVHLSIRGPVNGINLQNRLFQNRMFPLFQSATIAQRFQNLHLTLISWFPNAESQTISMPCRKRFVQETTSAGTWQRPTTQFVTLRCLETLWNTTTSMNSRSLALCYHDDAVNRSVVQSTPAWQRNAADQPLGSL